MSRYAQLKRHTIRLVTAVAAAAAIATSAPPVLSASEAGEAVQLDSARALEVRRFRVRLTPSEGRLPEQKEIGGRVSVALTLQRRGAAPADAGEAGDAGTAEATDAGTGEADAGEADAGEVDAGFAEADGGAVGDAGELRDAGPGGTSELHRIVVARLRRLDGASTEKTLTTADRRAEHNLELPAFAGCSDRLCESEFELTLELVDPALGPGVDVTWTVGVGTHLDPNQGKLAIELAR